MNGYDEPAEAYERMRDQYTAACSERDALRELLDRQREVDAEVRAEMVRVGQEQSTTVRQLRDACERMLVASDDVNARELIHDVAASVGLRVDYSADAPGPDPATVWSEPFEREDSDARQEDL